MTQDFIEDFVAKLEEEGKSFIILIGNKSEETGLVGTAQVRHDITKWRTIPTMSVRNGIVEILDETVFQPQRRWQRIK